MSKRKHAGETHEEMWLRKLKKYERKLEAKRCASSARRIIYSDEEDDVQTEGHLEYDLSLPPVECYTPEDGHESLDIENNAIKTPGDVDPSVQFADKTLLEEAASAEDDSTFDPSLVQALGDVEPETVEFGDNIHAEVAKQFEKILQSGLNKESKEELLKKYLFPANLPLAKSPDLNPEISGMLAEVCKVRDKRLLTKQTQLGKTLSALGKAITSLLKKDPDVPDIVRALNDAGKLLADSHFTESDTRRSVIIPLIDKSLAEPFKNRKRDTFLFRDHLCDLVKNSRGIKRTSQMIQASTSSTNNNNLNRKGPSFRGRHQQVAQIYQYRTGGPRPTTSYYASRRRGPPPPPPLPPLLPPPRPCRRQPPPPPPARRQLAQAQRFPPNRAA